MVFTSDSTRMCLSVSVWMWCSVSMYVSVHLCLCACVCVFNEWCLRVIVILSNKHLIVSIQAKPACNGNRIHLLSIANVHPTKINIG